MKTMFLHKPEFWEAMLIAVAGVVAVHTPAEVFKDIGLVINAAQEANAASDTTSAAVAAPVAKPA